MSADDPLYQTLTGAIRDGSAALELFAEYLEADIETARAEIVQIARWEHEEIGRQIERMEGDGTLVFDRIGNDLHAFAVDLDRRIASVVADQRQLERARYWDSLRPHTP
jgi:hypothetical protein